MLRIRRSLFSTIFAMALVAGSIFPAPFARADVHKIIDRAEASVSADSPSTQDDLVALFTALRGSRDIADQLDLIDVIATLGSPKGASPAAVKTFLREKAPPVLLEVARTSHDFSVRGAAMLGLRTLEAQDAALDEAIAIGEKDTGPSRGFMRSRADILKRWKDTRTQDATPQTLAQPPAPEREHRALDYLRTRRLGVSYGGLQGAIDTGDAQAVDALVDAGVKIAPGGDPRTLGAIVNGMTIGCDPTRAPLPKVVAALQRVVARGFDLATTDDYGNTLLMSAAQNCPEPVVAALLDLGAAPAPVNKQNFTPLQIALISGKWDVSNTLVAHGARLSKSQISQLFMELPTDPQQRAIVDSATTQ